MAAVTIGLWSLELKPGKPEVVNPQADIRITNVALGDVLADESGRTSVKFSYERPVQVDSDDEDNDDEENIQKKLTTTVLCSLRAGGVEQTVTDITLDEDGEYQFEVVGKNTVYLTGNYIDQNANNPPFDEDEFDSDEEDAYDLREVSSDVEMHPDDLDELSDASRFEEIAEGPPKSLKRARESDAAEGGAGKPSKAEKKKKLKGEGGKPVSAPEEPKKAEKEEKPEKKDKAAKKDKAEKKDKADKKDKPESKQETKELPGGLKVMDAKIGTGPMAKKGSSVSMRYIGKLTDGKIFDKNTKGKPFTFHLGQGEVIKGWDEGIVGMQVGGERRLTIPPHMAYGKKAQSGIPANSTLVFDCKLLKIK